MANKPVFGVVICPYCKVRNPIIWDGNFRYSCCLCHKTFNVKRQKLKDVKPIKIGRREGECI